MTFAVTNDLDALWPYFAPLWADLRKIAPGILLAGGYALLLKQRWLLSNVGIATVVNVRQWHDQIPRSTKDLDFIAEVGLIASPAHQRNLDATLNLHGYKVVEENARWQFARQLSPSQSVVLDFHTPTPTEPRSDIRLNRGGSSRNLRSRTWGFTGAKIVRQRAARCTHAYFRGRDSMWRYPIQLRNP